MRLLACHWLETGEERHRSSARCDARHRMIHGASEGGVRGRHACLKRLGCGRCCRRSHVVAVHPWTPGGLHDPSTPPTAPMPGRDAPQGCPACRGTGHRACRRPYTCTAEQATGSPGAPRSTRPRRMRPRHVSGRLCAAPDHALRSGAEPRPRAP